MNKAQKVVLYELKEEYLITDSFLCVGRVGKGDLIAYDELSNKEKFEVLAEFAKWGLENERN